MHMKYAFDTQDQNICHDNVAADTWCCRGYIFCDLLTPLHFFLNCSWFGFLLQHSVHRRWSNILEFVWSTFQLIFGWCEKRLKKCLPHNLVENNKEIERDLSNIIAGTGRSDLFIFIKWRDYFDKYLIIIRNLQTDSSKFWDTLTFLTIASPFLNLGYETFICPVSPAFFRHSLCRLKLKCTAARICLSGINMISIVSVMQWVMSSCKIK